MSESAPSATLTVRLGAPSTSRVTADWATADGVGRAGVNYISASGSLTFEPGETRKDITVALLHDSTIGNRPFYVRLRNVKGTARVKTLGTIFVEDADAAADLQVTSDKLDTVTLKPLGVNGTGRAAHSVAADPTTDLVYVGVERAGIIAVYHDP